VCCTHESIEDLHVGVHCTEPGCNIRGLHLAGQLDGAAAEQLGRRPQTHNTLTSAKRRLNRVNVGPRPSGPSHHL
jgi:hypothetical protein